MSGFTKLFSSIIDSTIWREPNETRLLWITMLAMSNKNGVVEASLPGLADRARISMVQCKEALVALSSPDEYSRTKEHEGRRIAETDGGWRILNHSKYREKLNEEERREQNRLAQAKWRTKQPPDEQKQLAIQDSQKPSPRSAAGLSGFEAFWSAYPKKKAKGDAEKAWATMKCGPLLPEILTAIDASKQSPEWKKEFGQFIPYPATWLRSKSWQDDHGVSPAVQIQIQEPKHEHWKEFQAEIGAPKAHHDDAPWLHDEYRKWLRARGIKEPERNTTWDQFEDQ